MSCVGDGPGGGGAALAVDEGYGLCAHVEYQGVHQRHVVLVARFTGDLEAGEGYCT